MRISLLWMGLICAIGLLSCEKNDKITISGEVVNPGNLKVVAFYEGETKLDSVYLSDQNKFKFERAATQPRLLSIAIGKNRYPVIVSPSENLVFRVDVQSAPERYDVSGSDLSEVLHDFTPLQQRKTVVEDSLQAEFVKLIGGKTEQEVENLRSSYLSKYRQSLQFYTEKVVAFAQAHPDLAGFYAMSTLDPDLAEQELIAYIDQIKDQFVENKTVTAFKQEIEKLRKTAIGQPASEIVAYTPNNKTVKLSDFRGKYVLVDFWASWCLPCRKENPNIVKIYHANKNKNFDILSVSLDNNPGSWMRAIEEDKLSWTNISDLKAWSSDLIIDYRIKAIPASVLVDPQGKIISKNLRGKDLEDFLAKVLK